MSIPYIILAIMVAVVVLFIAMYHIIQGCLLLEDKVHYLHEQQESMLNRLENLQQFKEDKLAPNEEARKGRPL